MITAIILYDDFLKFSEDKSKEHKLGPMHSDHDSES